MSVWESLSGMLRIEVTGADIMRTIQRIADRGINITDLCLTDEMTAVFCIRRKDCGRVKRDAVRYGERVRILNHEGLFWYIPLLLCRPILICSIFLILCLTVVLPARILIIQVEGGKTISKDRILTEAQDAGLYIGAERRSMRSEAIKNELLSRIPQLQWAGVNTYGCVAVIMVKERSAAAEQDSGYTISSLIAARDGVIQSITVTSGTRLCEVGDSVRKGQLLISGYTDCGFCIRAGKAEGEIYARTIRSISSVTPAEDLIKAGVDCTERRITILCGKKRINLWKGSGIWDSTCGRIYKEYYIKLPGNFVLPLGIAVEAVLIPVLEPNTVSETAALRIFDAAVSSQIRADMIAGTIQQKTESIAFDNGLFQLQGLYHCTEMIGRVHQEQIGVYHGENS